MSKTFTCCELIRRIREHQEAPTNNWLERDKLIANEFLHKAALKIINKRIKEWVKSEPVWTADYDYLFCDECKEWFENQMKRQDKLITAEIEKEKAEGTFYTNPTTKKILEEQKEKADKYQKELEAKEPKNNPPPFEKSPPE